MKKVITLLFAFTIISLFFTNIYATDLNNTTIIVNPYSENFYDTNSTDNVFDALSVGIVVASIMIIAGVSFFYLIPKD